ncbi:MAG: hypothetical protein WBS24_11810 [Terriglobales bacterium]
MISPCTSNDWKGSYTAALFQDDAAKVPTLIARAESEIVARARTLFESPTDNGPEIRALDNALRMLQILKSCLRSRAAETAPVQIMRTPEASNCAVAGL